MRSFIYMRGKDRDAAEALAVTVSTAIAKEIFPYTDGYYLMTPFRRVALMEHIIQNIQTIVHFISKEKGPFV